MLLTGPGGYESKPQALFPGIKRHIHYLVSCNTSRKFLSLNSKQSLTPSIVFPMGSFKQFVNVNANQWMPDATNYL